MIELKFAELHAPLFLGGTNLQMKLDPTKRTGLTIAYDRVEKELLVTYNGNQAIIPSSNVMSMTPGTVEKKPVASVPPRATVSAQVSTPMDHVFKGVGAGKSK